MPSKSKTKGKNGEREIAKIFAEVFGVIGWNLTLKDAMESSNEDLESILTFC